MKSPAFHALSESPLNGAPDPGVLVRSPITSAQDFFLRNHGDSSGIPKEWTLNVGGTVLRTLSYEVTETHETFPSSFQRVSLKVSLQCAGNRRTSLQHVRPVPNEIPWDNCAIGTAEWSGVRLKDVLESASYDAGAKHVWFLGAETLTGKHAGEFFGASIPLAKAIHPDTLIADTMNGAPLPAEHGGPLRVIVPGYIGARSVKWLAEIRVEHEPSPNHFQRAYSVFPSSMLAVPPGHHGGRVLGEFPVSSAFGNPEDGAQLTPGQSTVRGWAISGGDRTVTRVEVSADGGATWHDARFVSPAEHYIWRLWEADIALASGTHTLVCRATDSSGNTQPADASETWNVKGYANNCWDRATVHVG